MAASARVPTTVAPYCRDTVRERDARGRQTLVRPDRFRSRRERSGTEEVWTTAAKVGWRRNVRRQRNCPSTQAGHHQTVAEVLVIVDPGTVETRRPNLEQLQIIICQMPRPWSESPCVILRRIASLSVTRAMPGITSET